MREKRRFKAALITAAAVTASVSLSACDSGTIEQYDPNNNVNACVYGPAPIVEYIEPVTPDTPDRAISKSSDTDKVTDADSAETEAFLPEENIIPAVYGPPEMMGN